MLPLSIRSTPSPTQPIAPNSAPSPNRQLGLQRLSAFNEGGGKAVGFGLGFWLALWLLMPIVVPERLEGSLLPEVSAGPPTLETGPSSD
jgi:hypothetical protein